MLINISGLSNPSTGTVRLSVRAYQPGARGSVTVWEVEAHSTVTLTGPQDVLLEAARLLTQLAGPIQPRGSAESSAAC